MGQLSPFYSQVGGFAVIGLIKLAATSVTLRVKAVKLAVSAVSEVAPL